MDAETKAGDALASRPKISFVGVQKRYPGKGKNEGTLALDSFNFDLAPAEIVSIVGPTGCGKSTDRKSTRLNSSHGKLSRMPSSA